MTQHWALARGKAFSLLRRRLGKVLHEAASSISPSEHFLLENGIDRDINSPIVFLDVRGFWSHQEGSILAGITGAGDVRWCAKAFQKCTKLVDLTNIGFEEFRSA